LYPHHINALTVTERFPLVSYCRKKIIKTYSFAKVFCMKKITKKTYFGSVQRSIRNAFVLFEEKKKTTQSSKEI